ncbi:hypothetical protein MTR_5g096100 [Medicago truncatula]|uniref:Uncharacterized protein n=1 Tax=Medicago truncatula TaxID=3880 RepID=G7KEI4_MEDTR|nr:hypothetical protein MTR_5g096100 [Medicago truncatula]
MTWTMIVKDCMWEYDAESFLGDDMGENYFNDHLLKPTTRLTQPVSVEFEAAAGAHRNGGGWQYDTRDSLRNTARDFLNMLCAPQILD